MSIEKLLRACSALVSVAVVVGCANQPGGPSTRDTIQGAINAIGAGLGGKPGGASTVATGGSNAPVGGSTASVGGSTAPVGGKVVVINGTLIAVDGEHPTDPRWAGKQIKDTPLFHFFSAHPISRPGVYFPRIGIRIDDYSQSLVTDNAITKHLNGTAGAVPREVECLKFTAMIWMTEKQSQKIDNVVLCSSDISSKDGYWSLGALRTYRNTMAPFSISSMQVRSLGPRVPERLLPDFTPPDIGLYGQGQHLFSSLFSQLGYQGDGDQRLWFVNLASPAK
jgi:hypothetical protein